VVLAVSLAAVGAVLAASLAMVAVVPLSAEPSSSRQGRRFEWSTPV
jgi:hypothetical protein